MSGNTPAGAIGDGVVRFDGYKPAGESSQPYVP